MSVVGLLDSTMLGPALGCPEGKEVLGLALGMSLGTSLGALLGT